MARKQFWAEIYGHCPAPVSDLWSQPLNALLVHCHSLNSHTLRPYGHTPPTKIVQIGRVLVHQRAIFQGMVRPWPLDLEQCWVDCFFLNDGGRWHGCQEASKVHPRVCEYLIWWDPAVGRRPSFLLGPDLNGWGSAPRVNPGCMRGQHLEEFPLLKHVKFRDGKNINFSTQTNGSCPVIILTNC